MIVVLFSIIKYYILYNIFIYYIRYNILIGDFGDFAIAF